MMKRRVLAIGLDGYEESVEREMIAAGELPAIARLRSQSVRFLLQHGPSQRTGLSWEYVSTGLSSEAANRWSSVYFDPARYTVCQDGTCFPPFAAYLQSRTVVFDPPYYHLRRAPQVRGIVGWGAHDAGVVSASQPDGLAHELAALFGAYPADEFIYGHTWPSANRARRMGTSLTKAVDLRARAAQWLLTERLSDWDLALVVVSEPHSATEALWHGIDADHKLHHLPSAEPAREGMLSVYRAVDRLVDDLASACPDAAIVLFSMGGMGSNLSDVLSMALFPELIYRHAFGRPLFAQPPHWKEISGAGPVMGENDNWAHLVGANLPIPNIARRLAARFSKPPRHQSDVYSTPITWMPATRYQPYWTRMRAFALPSFYDGRVRINLAGRERKGIVPLSQYETVCSEIETLTRECVDPETGAGLVQSIERSKASNPLSVGPTESDVTIVWNKLVCALDHPKLGRIGPVPYRRPGGHTGVFGMAYVHSPEIEAADGGIRSSFDVVPTLIELLGEPPVSGISGHSLLQHEPHTATHR